MPIRTLPLLLGCALALGPAAHAEPVLQATLFEACVTPPVGTPLCGGSVPPMRGVADPLSARGVVLLPDGAPPIVLCAVDWVGIANASYDAWRADLAEAAGTAPDRVAVHTLHQHDAPFADADTEALLEPLGLGRRMYSPAFDAQARATVAAALREALPNAVPITHVGAGSGEVREVASNRRILGPDGRVAHMRWTACTDPALRAEPEGTIDPLARAVALFNGAEAVAVLSYYATHPQSFYRTGMVSADFVGMARAQRDETLGVPHIHFNGASGNIGAGKYNDGAPENRAVLAGRLAEGIAEAWRGIERRPLRPGDVDWTVRPATLPLRQDLDIEAERAVLADPEADAGRRIQAAREVAWHDRAAAGHGIPIAMLTLGEVRVLHMPGELFVEYQLAAQQLAENRFVCMAAYGDYAPGYIGTAAAYDEGGYETALRVSRTAPEVEEVLLGLLAELLAE